MQLSYSLVLAALAALGSASPLGTITLDDPTPTITPPPDSCYTYTTTAYPTDSCAPVSGCITLECIDIKTTTMPCPTLTCPTTATETEWSKCTTTCPSGCATSVTNTIPEMCPLATEA